MNQQQALEKAKQILPQIADVISVERSRCIGCKYGHPNQYWIWDHSNHNSRIVASSQRSWEHALAIAESGNEDIWPEQDAAWEDEVSA